MRENKKRICNYCDLGGSYLPNGNDRNALVFREDSIDRSRCNPDLHRNLLYLEKIITPRSFNGRTAALQAVDGSSILSLGTQ